MSQSYLEASTRKLFNDFISASRDKTVVAGRYTKDAGKEEFIWEDIRKKLAFADGKMWLDIGCGYGEVTQHLLNYAFIAKSELTLVDTAEILSAVREDLVKEHEHKNRLHFVPGYFPKDVPELLNGPGFDSILMYSVLHYIEIPMEAVEAAVKLLNPGGSLLLGDIPNVDSKGRFLSSTFGRAFEAEYRGVNLEQVQVYKNQLDYVEKNQQSLNTRMNDGFIAELFSRFRQRGFDVFVLPQPEQLPFSHTREDVVIRRYD